MYAAHFCDQMLHKQINITSNSWSEIPW